MKKLLILLMLFVFCLTGCSDDTSTDDTSVEDASDEEITDEQDTQEEKPIEKTYAVGDEIDLAGVLFDIYKIDEDNDEVYLMARNSVGTTPFSTYEQCGNNLKDYEGSLVEQYVNEFTDNLEDKGLSIISSGIIDKDDLYELGFVHSDGLSGLPYEVSDETPTYVTCEVSYWVGGWSKYDTYAWAYYDGYLDTEQCENEFGVRPIIVVNSAELNKPLNTVDENLTIQEIIESSDVWASEGGFENPYDFYFFDFENMRFINKFESSEMSDLRVYSMKLIDDKTIQIAGIRSGYEAPAEITIVNSDKLRVRFLDEQYNDSDNFFVKSNESMEVDIPEDTYIMQFPE